MIVKEFEKHLAVNMPWRDQKKILGLIGRYGLEETLEAVFLNVNDILDNSDEGDPDYEEAKRVHAQLDGIIGWSKN